METKVVYTDLYKITISRSTCRCGSCPTEQIMIQDSDDGSFVASYDIGEDYAWKFSENYSDATIGEILFELLMRDTYLATSRGESLGSLAAQVGFPNYLSLLTHRNVE